MTREQELQQLVSEQAYKLMDQNREIEQLKARLAAAEELARLGGWKA